MSAGVRRPMRDWCFVKKKGGGRKRKEKRALYNDPAEGLRPADRKGESREWGGIESDES